MAKRKTAEQLAQQKDRELTRKAKEFAKKVENMSEIRAYNSYVTFRFRCYLFGRKPATMVLPKDIAKISKHCNESEIEEKLEPLQKAYLDMVDFFNGIEGTMFGRMLHFSAEQEIILEQAEQILQEKGFQVEKKKKSRSYVWWDGSQAKAKSKVKAKAKAKVTMEEEVEA